MHKRAIQRLFMHVSGLPPPFLIIKLILYILVLLSNMVGEDLKHA